MYAMHSLCLVHAVLTLALRFGKFDIDVALWSQQISFVFVGILVFVSVRGFLIASFKVCAELR